MERVRQGWIFGSGLAVMATALSIFFLDRPAATFAHDAFHGGAVFVALTHIIDPVLPLAVIGFVLIGGAMLLGWSPPRAVMLIFQICIATLLAVVVKDQLKYAFGRTWPETWVNNNPSWIRDGVAGFTPFHGGAGWASFPSGHMTVTTAPMVVLMRTLGRIWRWICALPIALVAIGLYGADYHFVGDMLAGVMVGAYCAAVTLLIIETRRSVVR